MFYSEHFTQEMRDLYFKDDPRFIELLESAQIDYSAKTWGPLSRSFFITEENLLYVACHENRVNIVKALLKKGENPNGQSDKSSPLQVACKMGHEQIVDLLLQFNADPNFGNTLSNTPLFIAAAANNQYIINQLLAKKAVVDQVNKEGESILFSACQHLQITAVKNLIAAGANIEHTNNKGKSVLAALYDRLDSVNHETFEHLKAIFKLLLEAGVTIDKTLDPSTPEATPLTLYIGQKKDKGLKALGELLILHCIKKSPHAVPEDNRTKAFNIISGHTIQTQELMSGLDDALARSLVINPRYAVSLLERGATLTSDKYNTAWNQLLMACLLGNLSQVKELLSSPINKNDKDIKNSFPLDLACFSGNAALVSFLQAQSDPNLNCCSNHATPLIMASRYGQLELVKERLPLDDINAQSENKTALTYACSHGYMEIARLLMNHSDITPEVSALAASAEANNIELVDELLTSFNANDEESQTLPLWIGCAWSYSELVKHMINKGLDPNCTDAEGLTPLYWACMHNNQLLINFLLEKGANLANELPIILQDNQKIIMPLLIACEKGYLETLRILFEKFRLNQVCIDLCLMKACEQDKVEVVQFLLQQGANVNYCNSQGDTPLSIVTQHNNLAVARELLSYGASPFTENFLQNTPFSLAYSAGKVTLHDMFKLVETYTSSIYPPARPVVLPQETRSLSTNHLHEAFKAKVALLERKITQFSGNPELEEACKAAKRLHKALDDAGAIYFTGYLTLATYTAFKSICDDAFSEAKQVLDKHRGWSKILINILAIITTAGIGYALAAAVNIAVKGKFTFFSTDSSLLIDDLEKEVEQISPSHNR